MEACHVGRPRVWESEPRTVLGPTVRTLYRYESSEGRVGRVSERERNTSEHIERRGCEYKCTGGRW